MDERSTAALFSLSIVSRPESVYNETWVVGPVRMLRDLVKTTLLVPLFTTAMLGRADAVQLRVLVAGALKGAMETLVPDFEMVTGHKVDIAYDIIERIAARVRKGEAFDLAIESPQQWDALANEGKLDLPPKKWTGLSCF